eukprot:TRINITY_DN11810_c1_g3_i5.p1 TRINITY_DN11810_c1_g3~~TRINITY_DN11810_c1_g3_i5.p1  ORF type:complete len:178 (+),score=38.03 TRINITY_DN11810_c1_g3_i5:493-1026(+)
MHGDISESFKENRKTNQAVDMLTGTVESMGEQMEILAEEVDRPESFSRRDNLRVYGIRIQDFENFDSCAKKVVDNLNDVVNPPRTRVPDDIVRAHRVGQVVKFSRRRDKMTIITNKTYRHQLELKGVKVANDLTRKQRGVVKEAKKAGRVAFFRGGKLIMGPKRPDPRTYAEDAAAH